MFEEMKIRIENFIVNPWNLHGLQFLSIFGILMMCGDLMSLKQIVVMILLIIIIMFVQRMLGIRFGMLYYEMHKEEINRIMNVMKKMNERSEDE